MSLVLSLLSGNQALDSGSTPTFAGVKTNANVGTAGTGFTAVEYGDGYSHTTILTASTTFPAITGGVAQALGKLAYTFPAGALIINEAYFSLGITQSQGNINADTPEIGLGTIIASGAVATLDGTATFENIVTGQVMANCTGTAKVITLDESLDALVINAADTRTMYVNIADSWAAGGDTAAALAGTIVITWHFMA